MWIEICHRHQEHNVLLMDSVINYRKTHKKEETNQACYIPLPSGISSFPSYFGSVFACVLFIRMPNPEIYIKQSSHTNTHAITRVHNRSQIACYYFDNFTALNKELTGWHFSSATTKVNVSRSRSSPQEERWERTATMKRKRPWARATRSLAPETMRSGSTKRAAPATRATDSHQPKPGRTYNLRGKNTTTALDACTAGWN